MKRGKIILIEGTDSSGKGTQSRLLLERLKMNRISVELMGFPRYDLPSGRIVGQGYLGKRELGEKLGWDGDYCWFGDPDKVNPKVASHYYAANRLEALPEIEEIINSGAHLIFDRFVESNMGHQGGKLQGEKRLEVIEYIEELEYGLNGLPRPDIIYFLYMPTDHAIQLRKKRSEELGETEEQLDGHEANVQHLINAENSYLDLAERRRWAKINCVSDGKIRTREEINNEIYRHLIENVLGE